MVWGWIAAGISEEVAGKTYNQARAGQSAPGWFMATMPSPAFAATVGWDSENPVWHLWNWMGSPEAGEGAGVALDQFPGLLQKMRERWTVDFWIPLYSAACDMSYVDYAASLRTILPTVQQVHAVYGSIFVAPWYADIIDTDVGEVVRFKPVSAEEYLRRRAELGCPALSSSPIIPPGVLMPFTPKTPWAWTAFGVLVVGVAVSTVIYTRKTKRRRRRKK